MAAKSQICSIWLGSETGILKGKVLFGVSCLVVDTLSTYLVSHVWYTWVDTTDLPFHFLEAI